MNNQYNVWCKWHPLKTVVLGDCYPLEFYDKIKNNRIKSAFLRITEETLQDLENYEKVLKDFGCNVLRPKIDKNLSIDNFLEDNKLIGAIPRAPLQPRDYQIVLGNTLYYIGDDANNEFKNLLTNYNKDKIDNLSAVETDITIKISREHFEHVAGVDWLTYEDYLKEDYFEKVGPKITEEYRNLIYLVHLPSPPSITHVGKDVYIDVHNHFKNFVSNTVIEYFKNQFLDIRFNTVSIGGHNDGCFHTLKPGAILSLHDIQHYDETFPNWDVCYLENQSWDLVSGFTKIKYKVSGKWWVPGEEDNDEFIDFVETWLQDWVGYCEESVFDVNVLMLDEHHVCVNNYNETAFAFFKKHKIEPIIVPWRHRYFWDGGLHCITLDLYREGVMEDYFPARTKAIIDPGFD